MSRTLLDITGDLQALDNLLEELGGDISDPKVAEAIDGWFSELDKDLETKVDNYCALITEIENRAHLRKSESQRLYDRSKVDVGLAENLKARLLYALGQRNMKRVNTQRFAVSVAKNGGKLPVTIINNAAVPKDFCKHVPEAWEPDLDKIREALGKGDEVPGAVAGERGSHLRIG